MDQLSLAELHAALRYHVTEAMGIDVDRVIQIAEAMRPVKTRSESECTKSVASIAA
jgi:hypothetical protein